MRFPATAGWVSLPVVVGVPRQSWLRAPGAVPRHSWLGSAGAGDVWSLATPGFRSWLRFHATSGSGVRWRWWCMAPRNCGLRVLFGCFLATPGRGSRMRFPATPGWGPPAAAVAVLVGLGGGFPVLFVLVASRVRVVSVLAVCCVFMVSVLVVVGVCVCLLHMSVFVCVCVCVCVVCWWRVVVGPCSPRLGLLLVLVGVGLVCAVVSPLRLLAEVPMCDSPPLLAGFRCRW